MELYQDASHTGPEQHATVLQRYHSHKLPTGTDGSGNHPHLKMEEQANLKKKLFNSLAPMITCDFIRVVFLCCSIGDSVKMMWHYSVNCI
jgi:hypothetical protein